MNKVWRENPHVPHIEMTYGQYNSQAMDWDWIYGRVIESPKEALKYRVEIPVEEGWKVSHTHSLYAAMNIVKNYKKENGVPVR